VPGLSVSSDNRGASSIVIRGLNTGTVTNPSVATLIDEVPYSATTVAAMGWSATEFDPNELARIEVLRGPQGVLYGASSLGGLIKYVTIRPSTAGFSGRLQATATSVANGGEGYGLSGAVNVPVSDTFAVRVSAFGRHDPGYIDNVFTGEQDFNDSDVAAGRVSALWTPSARASLLLAAIYQRSENDGSPYALRRAFATSPIVPSPFAPALVPLGDLETKAIRGVGFVRTIKAYSGLFEADLGGVDLTVVSGYVNINRDGVFDFNNIGFISFNANLLFGQPFAGFVDDVESTKFSQEVRLAGSFGPRLEWMLGGFYTEEDTDRIGGYAAYNGLTGEQVGRMSRQVDHVVFEELAAFANMTWKFTDQFDVQFGARASKNEEAFESNSSGPFFPAAPVPLTKGKDDSITYLLTPRWKITPDVMLYGRLASGYRPGGTNPRVTSLFPDLPRSFTADTTVNYEVGVKGDFFDRLVTLDASAYYIDWQDMQISVGASNPPYIINTGAAVSKGVETAATVRPLDRLTLTGWAAYNEAEFAEDVIVRVGAGTQTFGREGDRLPYSPRWSGSISATQEFDFIGGSTGYVGATATYQGDRLGELTCLAGCAAPVARGELPSYTRVDLNAGTRFDTWSVNLYVNNVADERGVVSGGVGFFNPNAFYVIQPRTFGLSITKRWN
jgi:iron complex outermembrane receptor protein